LDSLVLSLSLSHPFLSLFKTKIDKKPPQNKQTKKNRALVYVFAHVLEGKIKKKSHAL
jgi:hypothetical protein